MNVTEARIIAIFALFVATMLAGFGPVFGFNLWNKRQELNLINSEDERNNRKSKSAKILHLLLVFGGGVLLATCFVHMIPEIQENYNHYMETRKHSHEKPTTIGPIDLSEVTILTKVSDDSTRNVIYQHQVHKGEEDDDDDDDDDDGAPWVQICICIGIFLTYAIEEAVILLIGRGSHHHNHTSNSLDRDNTKENVNKVESGYDNHGVDLRDENLYQTSNSVNGVNDQDHLLNLRNEDVWTRFLRGLIIVIAFLAHSIFDGVAIGLQTTTYSVWTIFFAICLHKLVVVFAIGFELFEKTGSLILTAIHIAIFSAMSPLGIILSIIIEGDLSEDGSLTLILLNAVATGAILYIVFLEILKADRCLEINGLIQLAALVAGFILMTLMTTLVGESD